MTVHCAQCGEELMGAVNRCWKCGTQFKALSDDPGRPPVRQAPRPLLEVRRSRLGRSGVALAEPEPSSATARATATAAVRRGSPFAAPPDHSLAAPRDPETPLAAPARGQQGAALGGAVASLVLGLIGLLAVLITPGSMRLLLALPLGLIGLLGIGLGVWGLRSSRRAPAIAGIMLCCLVIGIAGFLTALNVYTGLHGHGPFAPAEPESPQELPDTMIPQQ